MDNTAYISPEIAAELQAQSREMHIHSGLGFLNSHNGLRPGCVHTFLGNSSAGKSTMVRTVLRDFAFNKHNSENRKTMLVWLSEETLEEFKTELSWSIPPHDRLLDIKIVSEKDLQSKNHKAILTETIHSMQPDVLMFDNITTSSMYEDVAIKGQNEFSRWISEITTQMKMATILVAHTGGEVTENISRMINMNDIRGSKRLVNVSQFFYVLQTFKLDNRIFPCLTITKHRGQNLIHGMYQLDYLSDIRAYTKDIAINFNQFKEYYGKRNKF